MKTAANLVAQVTELVSFPDVAVQVIDMLADNTSDADSIGSTIEQDPALTATLLKLANSSLYGVGAEVDSVAKAFMRVGEQEIQELTLGICTSRAFSDVPNDILSLKDFWRHSLLCGAVARTIARRTKARNASMVFTGGLLHDIGHLVMFNLIPEESQQTLALCRDQMNGEDIYLAERELLGFDHMDVGKQLGEHWNWPSSLVKCIERHHQPFDYPDCSDAEIIVHIANSIATLIEIDSTDLQHASQVDERAWERLNYRPEQALEVQKDIQQEIAGLLKIFVS